MHHLCSSLGLILWACVSIITTTSLISEQVMKELDLLYEDEPKGALQGFSQIDLILLLSAKEEHRKALENTVHDKEKFKQMVHRIIETKKAEKAWTFGNIVAALSATAAFIKFIFFIVDLWTKNVKPLIIQPRPKNLRKKLFALFKRK